MGSFNKIKVAAEIKIYANASCKRQHKFYAYYTGRN
jgi:hypothetical protein